MKNERQSNLELLRIICMILIVSLHFITQSGIQKNDTLFHLAFYTFLRSFGRIACSVFVMIGAWFLVDSSFKMERIVKLWLTVFVYVLPITLICKYVVGIEVDYEEMFKCFFPIQRAPLWFAGYYMILLLEMPLLNCVIKASSKNKLLGFLIMFGGLMFGFSTLTRRDGIIGHNLTWFPYLYLLTGYFKRYPCKLFTKQWFNILMGGGIYVLLCSLIILCSRNDKYAVIKDYADFYRSRFWTLPDLLCAIGIFFFFMNLKVSYHKWINSVASTTFGIYVIHQVPVFYPYLWSGIFHTEKYIGTKMQCWFTLFVIWTTFIGGMLIEFVRLKWIMPFLMRPFKRICMKIDTFVNDDIL